MSSSHTRSPRRLWYENHDDDSVLQREKQKETIDDLLERFSSRPPPRSFFSLWRQTWVVGQEFSITCMLLAGHRLVLEREQSETPIAETLSQDASSSLLLQVGSMMAVSLTLLMVLLYSQGHTTATLTRSKDAMLLAGMLRLISSVLHTLTESYSSDTVHALAITGMLIHLLACDYSYANGCGDSGSVAALQSAQHNTSASSFRGGTVSLNAALVSTTLLASRLSSNGITVYLFVSLAVILFCFYPAARHMLSRQEQYNHGATLLVTILFSLVTWTLLRSAQERAVFGGTLAALCVLAPLWNCFYLQRHKVRLAGPWDIAHIVVTDL